MIPDYMKETKEPTEMKKLLTKYLERFGSGSNTEDYYFSEEWVKVFKVCLDADIKFEDLIEE